MQCPVQDKANADLLLAYCARTVDPESREVLERHMAGCAECREFAEQQQKVWSALDAWNPEPVSQDFDRRLYARIASEERTPWWKRLLPGPALAWRPALSVAAACLTVVAVFLLRGPGIPDQRPRVRMEAVEVEQVEKVLEDMDMLRQWSLTPAYSEVEAPKS